MSVQEDAPMNALPTSSLTYRSTCFLGEPLAFAHRGQILDGENCFMMCCPGLFGVRPFLMAQVHVAGLCLRQAPASQLLLQPCKAQMQKAHPRH